MRNPWNLIAAFLNLVGDYLILSDDLLPVLSVFFDFYCSKQLFCL